MGLVLAVFVVFVGVVEVAACVQRIQLGTPPLWTPHRLVSVPKLLEPVPPVRLKKPDGTARSQQAQAPVPLRANAEKPESQGTVTDVQQVTVGAPVSAFAEGQRDSVSVVQETCVEVLATAIPTEPQSKNGGTIIATSRKVSTSKLRPVSVPVPETTVSVEQLVQVNSAGSSFATVQEVKQPINVAKPPETNGSYLESEPTTLAERQVQVGTSSATARGPPEQSPTPATTYLPISCYSSPELEHGLSESVNKLTNESVKSHLSNGSILISDTSESSVNVCEPVHKTESVLNQDVKTDAKPQVPENRIEPSSVNGIEPSPKPLQETKSVLEHATGEKSRASETRIEPSSVNQIESSLNLKRERSASITRITSSELVNPVASFGTLNSGKVSGNSSSVKANEEESDQVLVSKVTVRQDSVTRSDTIQLTNTTEAVSADGDSEIKVATRTDLSCNKTQGKFGSVETKQESGSVKSNLDLSSVNPRPISCSFELKSTSNRAESKSEAKSVETKSVIKEVSKPLANRAVSVDLTKLAKPAVVESGLAVRSGSPKRVAFAETVKDKSEEKRTQSLAAKKEEEVEEEESESETTSTETTDSLIFSGEYTKAMSKDWHSGHFCCWQCDESLTGQRYVLRDDHPYCIKCYESVFANICEECNKTIGIDSKDLSYKDKHWHEACFLCNKCRVSLVDKQFGSKADKIYCGNCYDAQFASRCDGCGEIFRAGTKKMEYKTRQWHEKCFCCCVCKSAIGTKSFIPREQEIYCATCYEEKFATRCVKCNKIITTGGVTYKNEPWHRECFTCTHCNTSLAGQRFTSRDEKPYCAECFGELFAKRCTACSKPITGIGGTRFISFEDRHWHNDCFICATCKTSLVGRGFITDGADIICPECAKQKLM